jgi:hypothetical protein
MMVVELVAVLWCQRARYLCTYEAAVIVWIESVNIKVPNVKTVLGTVRVVIEVPPSAVAVTSDITVENAISVASAWSTVEGSTSLTITIAVDKIDAVMMLVIVASGTIVMVSVRVLCGAVTKNVSDADVYVTSRVCEISWRYEEQNTLIEDDLVGFRKARSALSALHPNN